MTPAARYLLLFSLALNLSLGVALAWFHWHRPAVAEAPPPRGAMFRHDALRDALAPRRGGLVDAVAARHRETMRVRIERMDEARATVREALRAEPFDRAALDDAFAGLREADSRTAAEAHALISEVAAEANPSERERLSRLMEGRRRRGNHHPPPH